MEVIQLAARRIEKYHKNQIVKGWLTDDEKGVELGQRILPLGRVGIYTPGGKAFYPSTLLMAAIPAHIAGVEEIILVSPAKDGKLNPLIAAAAEVSSVHRIFKVGGAQAAPAGPAPAAADPSVPPEETWKTDILTGTDIRPDVFEAVFRTAVEISREGREGKPIGTAFIVGDSPEVLASSKQLILNPFEGHDPSKRLITNPSNVENVKEFALLDGVFIVSGAGVIEAAGRYLTIDTSTVRIPMGLGTRHGSVAGMTGATRSVGIVVSQSGGRISVFRRGEMVKQYNTLQ